MNEEVEKKGLSELPTKADRVCRSETIKTTEQNKNHAQALASNPDQFPSIANLSIPDKEKIEPFQIVDDGKTIAASRKIESESVEMSGNQSFHDGLKALPQGATPEQLAQYQTEYILSKAQAFEAAGAMPAITSGLMLEGRIEKTQSQNNEYYERMAGFLIGSVQGMGSVAVNLAHITDFAAYCISGDHENAEKMGAEFGKTMADAAWSGIQIFHAADKYVREVGQSGDYSKPFQDINNLAVILNHQWQQLPPREQERRKAELITQLVADGFIGFAGVQQIKRSENLTELFRSITDIASKTSVKSKEAINRAKKAISNTLDDLITPVADTGTGIKMKVPKTDDLALKMEGKSSNRAFRGDDDFKLKFDKDGYAKSHINEKGDLVPANVDGTIDGRPVDVIEHICDLHFQQEKAHSPFTSLSISGEIAMRYGNQKLTVNLAALRSAIKEGSVVGTELIEHSDLLNLIEKSNFDPFYKKMANIMVREDKEMLVKGPIPASFLEY